VAEKSPAQNGALGMKYEIPYWWGLKLIWNTMGILSVIRFSNIGTKLAAIYIYIYIVDVREIYCKLHSMRMLFPWSQRPWAQVLWTHGAHFGPTFRNLEESAFSIPSPFAKNKKNIDEFARNIQE